VDHNFHYFNLAKFVVKATALLYISGFVVGDNMADQERISKLDVNMKTELP